MIMDSFNKSYEIARKTNESLNKETIKVSALQIGMTIHMQGYTFTITDIHEYQEGKWTTPRLLLTGYNNVNDEKKLYTLDFSILSYVMIINEKEIVNV
jgi:asparagine N-glycosylation enzyme membrane subunit Stt3